MHINKIKLKNWRNFKQAEVGLRDVTYIIGANAAGKSNFLDVFRFLRDIAKPQGGGLQKALADRGGLKKVRCLHARRDPEVVIEVALADNVNDEFPKWRYKLAIKFEVGGVAKRPIVAAEEVFSYSDSGAESVVLSRPSHGDKRDPELLTQTALEQIQSNGEFRDVASHFADTTYLHIVPQLLKYGDFIGGRQLDNDPFGQGFLTRIAQAPEKTRKSRLNRIGKALAQAVPQFQELRFATDEIGHPHLEAIYTHHRPGAGWQREDQFSDGTLRLIALFWLLLENDSLLLLEEPELSLNEEIIRQLPLLLDRVRRSTKKRPRQILISTHSTALLENKGIDPRGVLRLSRVSEGTEIVMPTDDDLELLRTGLSPAEVLLPKVHPQRVGQLELL